MMYRQNNLLQRVMILFAIVSVQIPASPAQTATKNSGKGNVEKIVVHGHWILDVRDKDGHVVDHRDFENAIDPAGQVQLADVLAGKAQYEFMAVKLTGPGAPLKLEPTTFPCSGDYEQPTLCASSLTTITTGTADLDIVGSYTATSTSTFTSVHTDPYVCSGAGCTGQSFVYFTTANLGTPLSLVSGQTLTVHVVLSFS